MNKKGLIAVLLALLTALTPVFASAAPNSDYTLVSPYKDVDWSSRKAYKTGLHTHSSVSDGSETFRNMIYAAYEQNYDILSFSEHGITGRAWDKTPFIRPLYLYSYLLGYDKKPLTPEEFAAVTDGSAALEGNVLSDRLKRAERRYRHNEPCQRIFFARECRQYGLGL